jgi:hypothetical protein
MRILRASLLIAACAIALAGCKKESVASQAAPQTPASNAVAASAQPLAGPVHPFMTSLLRSYIREKGRSPTDFGEFARACLDSVPRAPDGMKWDIDLTTQEVKLVKEN